MDYEALILVIVSLVVGFSLGIPIAGLVRRVKRKPNRVSAYFVLLLVICLVLVEYVASIMGIGLPISCMILVFMLGVVFRLIPKETISDFFGPSVKAIITKIIGGVGLFSLITIIHKRTTWRVCDYWPTGFPFTFSWKAGLNIDRTISHGFSIEALIFDVVFWYIVLCSITFVYKKIRKKLATR